MARIEEDREDLMKDATAYQKRIEISINDETNSVIVGVKADGSMSVYFGADPVFHFNSHRLLKRCFVGGLLYRTQGTTLAKLQRERSDEATTLLRHDLSSDELSQFLLSTKKRLHRLFDHLCSGEFTVLQVVASDDDAETIVVSEILSVLRDVLKTDLPQLAPTFAGKK